MKALTRGMDFLIHDDSSCIPSFAHAISSTWNTLLYLTSSLICLRVTYTSFKIQDIGLIGSFLQLSLMPPHKFGCSLPCDSITFLIPLSLRLLYYCIKYIYCASICAQCLL